MALEEPIAGHEVEALGDLWDFDVNLLGERGADPGATVGSRRVGIAADGAEVVDANGVPESRFGTHALTVEQAATNILTANQRDCEGGTAGFTAVGTASLFVDPAIKVQGAQSLVVICASAGVDGVETNSVAPVESTQYTGSLYVFCETAKTLKLALIDLPAGQIAETIFTTIPGKWMRVTATGTTSGISTGIKLRLVETVGADNVTFWIDQLQVETGAGATTWADGARAVGNLAYPASLVTGFDSITIGLWVRLPATTPTAVRRFITLRGTAGADNVINVHRTASGSELALVMRDSAGTVETLTYTSAPWDGQWHMITAVVRGASSVNRAELYVDGARVASGGGTISTIAFASIVDFHVGHVAGASMIGANGDGLLDDLLVVGYAASAEQIAEWYTQGALRWGVKREETKGETFPAPGMDRAAWGTHVDASQVVTLSGRHAMHFKSTTRATVHLTHEDGNWPTVRGGRSYAAAAVVRADSAAAGKKVQAFVDWLDGGKKYLSSGVIHDDVVAAINAWEQKQALLVAPDDARFARGRFGRSGASFNAYVDSVSFLPAVPTWQARIDGVQSIGSGVETEILWDAAETVDVTFHVSGGQKGRAVITTPGTYYIQAFASFGTWNAGFNDATEAYLMLLKNGGAVTISDKRQVYAPGGAGTGKWTGHAACLLHLDVGDDVSVGVFHNHGVARSLDTGFANLTAFYGTRIM